MKQNVITADSQQAEHKRCEDDTYAKLIRDIKNVIDSDVYAVESVEQLAREFKISSGHIKNIFKKYTGITIFDYLFEKRMSEAKKLLDSSDLKVYEIAGHLGYKSRAFFSRTFQKYIGITPSEYRKRGA